MRKVIALLIITAIFSGVILPANCKAQQDTASNDLSDSARIAKLQKKVKRATVMSAALPGLGQIYNKDYWKVPIVYAGFGTIIYFIGYNHQNYTEYKQLYANVDSKGPVSFYDYERFRGLSDRKLKDGLKKYMDYHRRYRDISVLSVVGFYLLNIIDAYVSAYLERYSIQENLSMNVSPEVISNPVSSQNFANKSPGISVTFRF